MEPQQRAAVALLGQWRRSPEGSFSRSGSFQTSTLSLLGLDIYLAHTETLKQRCLRPVGCKRKNREFNTCISIQLVELGEGVTEIMNPVYSPGSSGVPYANAKGIGYPAGFPMGYAAAAPAYSPNMYPGANPTFQTGYTPGTPYKVSCSPTSGAVPPYSSSPNPYQTAVYPVRSAYPQQNPYAQQGTYYTQPLYAAPPHVIHHTTVVQPNGMPATMYPAPIPPPRGNGVTMGMVAGTTMAMSAGKYQLMLLAVSVEKSVNQNLDHGFQEKEFNFEICYKLGCFGV
ncbi:myelin-associated neurite-outgrowth inhibitor [Willisornis vidua]|uniref:Myelin-associated neurite-outgrowth inhibitor n=3 Tax=Neoaves TaxID=3078114 RepID=A0ABQ9DCD6_9PASS|nr:myelin-associated neurite-outgrowth inhibitor [Willisornis vidua]